MKIVRLLFAATLMLASGMAGAWWGGPGWGGLGPCSNSPCGLGGRELTADPLDPADAVEPEEEAAVDGQGYGYGPYSASVGYGPKNPGMGYGPKNPD